MTSGLQHTLITAATAALLFTPVGADAQSNRWLPYQGHLTVHFAIDHNGLSMTRGTFRDVTGELTLDPDNPEDAEVSVRIEAASLDTGMFYRDHAVRSDWFLNARKFRYIDFKSTKIERTGDNAAKMTGDLTMHGETKPVTFDVTLNKRTKRPDGADYYGFSATGSLNRLDWGVIGFSRLQPPAITGELVHFEIAAEWVRQE